MRRRWYVVCNTTWRTCLWCSRGVFSTNTRRPFGTNMAKNWRLNVVHRMSRFLVTTEIWSTLKCQRIWEGWQQQILCCILTKRINNTAKQTSLSIICWRMHVQNKTAHPVNIAMSYFTPNTVLIYVLGTPFKRPEISMVSPLVKMLVSGILRWKSLGNLQQISSIEFPIEQKYTTVVCFFVTMSAI